MADTELLLTINGTDVTEAVWRWSDVSLSDAWDQNPSLSFTLTQAYEAESTVAAYADVRLVNLLTGTVLFEGVVQPGELVQSERDPGWIDTDVRCVGYQGLFATSRVQVAIDWAAAGSLPAASTTAAEVEALLAVSFADARVDTTPTMYSHPSYDGGYVRYTSPFAADERAGLATALANLAGASGAANAARDAWNAYNAPVIKLMPGLGLVIAAPSVAVRGAAPVTLTAASFGRPVHAAVVTDGSDLASYGYSDYGSGDWRVERYDDYSISTDPANGYAVWMPDRDNTTGPTNAPYWWYGLGGQGRTFYRIVAPLMPHDVLVGHQLTFDTAWLGSITGTVQQVDTTFADGVFETAAAAWPWFLDGTKTINGTWELDDTSSRSIPRRMRRSTIILAASNTSPATPKRTVSRLRAGTY